MKLEGGIDAAGCGSYWMLDRPSKKAIGEGK